MTQDYSQQTNKDNGFSLGSVIGPIGALAVGLSGAGNKGNRYVRANWKGGGLADTGLGYISNQNYINPYDAGQMLSAMFGGSKGFLKNILGSNVGNGGMTLSDMNNADNIFGGYGLNTQGYTIPQGLGFLGPNIAGQPTTAVGGSSYDYSLPTSTSWNLPSWLGGK